MSNTLTKAHIIEAIAEADEIYRTRAAEIAEILIEIIKRALESGEDVLISGFGKFCVKEKNKRRGRNPATGENMILKPRRTVTFKCSGNLRKLINY